MEGQPGNKKIIVITNIWLVGICSLNSTLQGQLKSYKNPYKFDSENQLNKNFINDIFDSENQLKKNVINDKIDSENQINKNLVNSTVKNNFKTLVLVVLL